MTHPAGAPEQTFAPADLTAIATLEEKFAGLIEFSVDERRRLNRMCDKSEAFCRQTLILLDQNRQIIPPELDLDEAPTGLRRRPGREATPAGGKALSLARKSRTVASRGSETEAQGAGSLTPAVTQDASRKPADSAGSFNIPTNGRRILASPLNQRRSR